MSAAEVVAAYLREREALIGAIGAGRHATRDLSDLTDRAVSAMAETALSRLNRPWVLLALGGWGAGRLLPGSDLDLLVVTDAAPAELKPAVSQILYPLWDAGLDVGHQVRRRRDHVRYVRDDADTLTASLTGRALAGDAALGERVLSEVATNARKRAKKLLAGLAARERPGSPYLLEPDLKEGAGGQRDLDELAWTASVLSGSPCVDHRPLRDLGILSSGEAARLSEAGELITAARWALHAAGSRSSNLLTLETAEDVSLDLAALQSALADVHHLLLRVRARVAGRPLPGDIDTGPLSAAAFQESLAHSDSLTDLEDAAWSGRLDDLAVGLTDLLTLRRPALGHLYTVGAHSLRCATRVASPSGGDPLAARAIGELEDVFPVQIAALLHDMGKSHPGPGHAERAARAAATLAPRFGLVEAQVEDVVLLVREHLLLAETAATEDVHDEDVVLRTASRVGRTDLLLALYLLTVADSEATGPGTWTPWQAALVGELADRVASALSDDSAGAGVADAAEGVRRTALGLLPVDASPDATAFVRDASLRYLAAHAAPAIVAHANLAATIAASGDPLASQVAVSPGPADETWLVTVAAKDRLGLFAATAGAFALSGLDILAADAFGAPGDVALDTFVVRRDTLAKADSDTWATFERYLNSALAGHLALDARLADRRKHYRSSKWAEPIVSVETTGAYATAVYVTASDRVGLLYDIAEAIAESGLDIRWAKVSTRSGMVRDVFHVVDATGQPVDDPGALGHVAMLIRERA